MKKLLTNASFEKIIADYKEDENLDNLIAVFEALELLATNIVKYFLTGNKNKVAQEVFKNKKSIIRELVCYAFTKIPRYDTTKGKAFNFFTTIMLCYLRQVYRTRKTYAELKVKYAEEAQNPKTGKQKLYRRRK